MLLILSALLVGSAPSATATRPPQESDPIVCKGRSESVVGTRIKPKRTCMRKSDWDYIEKNTQRELMQINQRGNNPGRAEGRSE